MNAKAGAALPNSSALTEIERHRMVTPLWEQAKSAMDAGDVVAAKDLVDRAAAASRSLQVFSINWIASLLTFVADEIGEEAVEKALRKTGEEFIGPRRDTGVPWSSLPAAARAKVIARAMVANGSTLEVEEDEEKITLSFRCGSGGHLVDEGKYEGENPYATLREPAGRTFMLDALPVYCAHCAIHNEIQPIEWGQAAVSVEYPTTRAGEPCVHHVYKDLGAVPPEASRRLGKLAT